MAIPSLDQGIQAFHRKEYENAIDLFKAYGEREGELDPKEGALLDLWVGKCFFYIGYEKTFTYTVFIPGPRGSTYPAYQQIGRIFTKKYEEALQYFSSALAKNPELAKGYFWKGKTLERMERIGEAYEAYILAANFSPFYRRSCSRIFAKYDWIPFRKAGNLPPLAIEEVIRILPTLREDPYRKMEICHSLNESSFSLSKKTEKIIRQALIPLAGQKIFCFYIPFTGDRDGRVANFAREIINQLGNYNVHP